MFYLTDELNGTIFKNFGLCIVVKSTPTIDSDYEIIIMFCSGVVRSNYLLERTSNIWI